MITSPVTGLSNVKLNKKIDSSDIIIRYKRDFDIDVGKYFEGKTQVYIYECLDTGFLFFSPEGMAGDESFYDELKIQMPVKYNVPYYSEDKWEYGVCAEYIEPGNKVYEIGAGNGAFLRKLIDKQVTDVFGSELNHYSIKTALEKGIKLEYKTIEERAEVNETLYDVVCTFQVLEHVSHVKSFLDSAIKILKPGGKLMIAVPFNNPYLFGYDVLNTLNLPPHHMGLWNKQVFQKIPFFYPLKLENIIIEDLAGGGYDFDQFYKINKDRFFAFLPYRKFVDKIYRKFLRKYHHKFHGKNIIAIYKV